MVAVDAVPESLADGTPAELREALQALLGEDQVLHRVSDLVRYASDASAYRFLPQVVVVARDVEDVSRVLRFARERGRSVVFRAAGTSLNGQAQGDDILVDVRRAWSGLEVLDDRGERVRLRPGTVVEHANRVLARHGRVLGPDPASASAATIGGVVANNSSGMNAGTERNSYRMAESMTVVLPSGTVVDTAAEDADARLREAEPRLWEGLRKLKAEVEGDPRLVARIRQKYRIKNTSGYRLDALLDGSTPVEMVRGLMVGSEGTLGFIAEVVFRTLELARLHSTGLFFFTDLPSAAAAVPGFVAAGAYAVELMDGNTLKAATVIEGVPRQWAELPPGTAALLVEYRASDPEELARREREAEAHLRQLALLEPGFFSRDAERAAFYWKVRKSFVTVVGGARPSGTTLITEDFCVPPERLAEACAELLRLQEEFGFTVAVAGHASAGNLHYLVAFDASDEADVRRYAAFLDAFCRMTSSRFDGSLKAEHGTGRNMAPFLELEWGAEATELMWLIKELFDPAGVLAPGVVLDRDPEAHLRGLKTIPTVEAVADPCIECGFCEPVCPSRDLTTTPRQRIVLLREMLRQPEGSAVRRALERDYGYDAVDTCAGDSSCRLACPVGIDTGVLMREFRHRRHSPAEERIAWRAAKDWGLVERSARLAMRAGDAVRSRAGDKPLIRASQWARRVVPTELLPEWLPELPPAAARELPATERERATAVYYPACFNRIFGERAEGLSLPEAVVALGERAGSPVWIPPDVVGTCCATIWHSKGYADGNALMANRIVEAAWAWTDGGRLPLVVDASSCSLGIAREVVPYLTGDNLMRHQRLSVVDSLVWARDLLPRLAVSGPVGSAVVHPTCSMRVLGDDGVLAEVASAFAAEVVVPDSVGCCAFAGDRGMLHKELTASASAPEAREVRGRAFDVHVSANRMCEVGMEHATGRSYESVLVALERATR